MTAQGGRGFVTGVWDSSRARQGLGNAFSVPTSSPWDLFVLIPRSFFPAVLVLAGASAWGPFPASMTDSLFSFLFFSVQRGGTAQPGSACRLFPGCCFGIRFFLSPSELLGEREVQRELHKCHADCALSPTKPSLAAIPSADLPLKSSPVLSRDVLGSVWGPLRCFPTGLSLPHADLLLHLEKCSPRPKSTPF